MTYYEMCKSFDARKVSDFTDSELSDFVDILCDDGIKNDEHQTRALLRITALNHVRMERFIRRLNTQNGITADAVRRLTYFAVVLATIQVVGVIFFIWRDFNPRLGPVDKDAKTQTLHQNKNSEDVHQSQDPLRGIPPPAE